MPVTLGRQGFWCTLSDQEPLYIFNTIPNWLLAVLAEIWRDRSSRKNIASLLLQSAEITKICGSIAALLPIPAQCPPGR
jgi:hypothetical protein